MSYKSIVKFPYRDNWDELANAIVSVTKSKIDAVSIDGEFVRVVLVHHDGPVCSHCGGKIHDYGHGLCLQCWMGKNPIGR